MRILPNFNVNTIEGVIGQDFPDFQIDSIVLINNGWDNVAAEINGKYIFRFPKDSGVNLDLEIKVLDSLKNKISVQIPEVEFRGKSYDYYGYVKIPGSDLTSELYRSMTEEEKDKLAFELASFLKEIHESMTLEEARKIGVSQKIIEWYLDNVNDLKSKFSFDHQISQFVNEVIRKFEKMFRESNDLVLLYNDLHDENIAIDPVNKKLNGVFDFGDVSIGDRNFDFSPMYRFYSADLTQRMVYQYEKITGKKLNLHKIKIYSYIWEISDVGELFDDKENTVYKQGMARIKEWAAEDNE